MVKLTEEEVKNNIIISEMDILYPEEIYRVGREVFVALDCTDRLETEADKVRVQNGQLPLFDYSREYDSEGWYNFCARCREDRLEALEVETEHTKDEGGRFQIPVDKETAELIFRCIVSQLGKPVWRSVFKEE